MAGSLPDLPGHRFKLDEDGTILFGTSSSTGMPENRPDVLSQLVDLDGTSSYALPRSNASPTVHWFFFPEPRTVTAAYALMKEGSSGTWAYSTNTTTGTDGTWSNFSGTTQVGVLDSSWRTGVNTVNLTNVRGLRHTTNTSFAAGGYYLSDVAIYGYRPTDVDRLAFWDASTDAQISNTALDFGDVRSPTDSPVKSFRIKNVSTTLTAQNVHVLWDFEKQPNTKWALASMELSLDQEEWAVDVELGNMAPNSISPIIYARAVVPESSELIVRTAWLRTTNTGFTA